MTVIIDMLADLFLIYGLAGMPNLGTAGCLTWGIGYSMRSMIMSHLGNDAIAAESVTSVMLIPLVNTIVKDICIIPNTQLLFTLCSSKKLWGEDKI